MERFTIPTESLESDGALEWRKTTLVLVRISTGRLEGLGYTYADKATAGLIHNTLADLVKGMDAMPRQQITWRCGVVSATWGGQEFARRRSTQW